MPRKGGQDQPGRSPLSADVWYQWREHVASPNITATGMSDIIDNRAHHRFELDVDGHVAMSFYKLAEGVITFVHTEVPPELGGEGVGSRLIQGALDQVRAEGLKVVAQCPFVKAWIGKRSEYQDLLKAHT